MKRFILVGTAILVIAGLYTGKTMAKNRVSAYVDKTVTTSSLDLSLCVSGAGIDLPKDKRIEIGLTYIYGIGRKSAQDILAQTGINPDTRVKDLTEAEEAKLREAIDQSYTVEGDLRRQVALDIKRLTEIGCYRGTRHRRGLPVRGQRSKTNARTRKGPKKTIANKKK